MSQRASLKGPAYAIGSALLFGASTPLAKQLLGAVDPWVLAGLLYAGAGIGLLIVRLIASGSRFTLAIPRSDWPWLVSAIAFGGGLAPVLLMLGLAATDAARVFAAAYAGGSLHGWNCLDGLSRTCPYTSGLGHTRDHSRAAVLAWSGAPTLRSAVGPLLVAAACLAWVSTTISRARSRSTMRPLSPC